MDQEVSVMGVNIKVTHYYIIIIFVGVIEFFRNIIFNQVNNLMVLFSGCYWWGYYYSVT
ncbi:hypothetical protein RhiirC2_800847 [Rhizophagus irregularis]|uniref:Uncharacterized protein n=1 Tax=Rhizophagus irregularis TaxID=588596 RepID=A0A2N1M337_9GLOM|nr:hypothetical protein RhiirC2_800847 [Rhizophagus irregularis]